MLLLFYIGANAQGNHKRIDLRFGAGTTRLGSNRYVGTTEMEINRKFTPYWAVGVSLAYGRNVSDQFRHTSFEQSNVNFFISPFRNNRKNDFRMGAGLSYYDMAEAFATGMLYNPLEIRYDSYKTNSFGFNLIIENSYMLNGRFFIGIKASAQPYLNKGVNYGATLKAGVNW